MNSITHSKAVTLAFAALAALGFAAFTAHAQTASRQTTINVPPDEALCRHCVQPYAQIAHLPPAHFDPVTASDAQLAFYGYPPRPDATRLPQAYAVWKRVMSLHTTRIVPQLQATILSSGQPNIIRNQQRSTGDTVGGTSSNWSGYVIDDKKKAFAASNTQVFASFIVPAAKQAFGSCTGKWDYSSEWVGIDGDTSTDLMQAGIEADAKCVNNATTSSYYPWYEWVPNNQTAITNFPLAQGDEIFMYIWVTNKTTGNYYISDVTSGVSSSLAFKAPKGTSLVGDSVEWIVERTQIGGKLPTLTNYISDPWYYAFAETPGASYSVDASNGDPVTSVTMTDGGKAISYSYTTTANGLSYVDPKNATSYYSGNAFWFFPTGKAYSTQ